MRQSLYGLVREPTMPSLFRLPQTCSGGNDKDKQPLFFNAYRPARARDLAPPCAANARNGSLSVELNRLNTAALSRHT